MPQAPHNPRVLSGLGPNSDKVAAEEQGLSPQPRDQSLPVLKLDPRTFNRALDCVHCGLCLPACPTYAQTGLEADSPRGRIYLMKELSEGKIEASEKVMNHLDLCLDCRACETACPSGVVYHELIEETRAVFTPQRPMTATDKLLRGIFLNLFTEPLRLKLALLPARIIQKIGLWNVLTHSPLTWMLPKQFRKMQQMLPPDGPLWESNLHAFYPANPQTKINGKPRAIVGMFAGCVGSVLFQHVNRQTIELLQRMGCDVYVPRNQACCGAIHHHAGDMHGAEELARRNIEAFASESFNALNVDFIVNNISGCGAMLKDLPFLLRDDKRYAARAQEFVKKVRDISQLIVELKPEKPQYPIERTVTYHDACHLSHGQKVTAPPREMLGWIAHMKLIPLRESDMCCGAAGTYNLTQPDMAMDLAERKIKHIQATGATTCVTGNVGCAMQIQSEAQRLGVELQVVHPVTLLHEAYFGPRAGKK